MFGSVVPKRIRAVTQIKEAIMSYLPSYFAVIAHSGFGSALPLEGSHITPRGNLPSVWKPLVWMKKR